MNEIPDNLHSLNSLSTDILTPNYTIHCMDCQTNPSKSRKKKEADRGD